MDEKTCLLFDVSRGTTHDGPGIRTTFFFKGCPLRCLWCHNPEGISGQQELWWDQRTCIRCLECQKACRCSAIVEAEDRLRVDSGKCTTCGDCVEACPSRAMAFTGKEWSLEPLIAEALKDKEYYASFSGGVTASGGEPLGQFMFIAAFFEALKEKGIHTALDTSGVAPREAFDAVLPFTDLILYDLKILDPEKHRRYTGRTNAVVMENLAYVAETYVRGAGGGRKLWIRTPLIPGATADEENISAIGSFIRSELGDVVERWELCAFNNACAVKYRKMDKRWAMESTPILTQDQVEKLEKAALASGVTRDRLVVSGLIAKPKPRT